MSHLHWPLVKKALMSCVGMFGFSFCLIPLYSVLCKATGIDGKGLLQQEYKFTKDVDMSRLITIEFDSNVSPALNFTFGSSMHKAKIHPGEPLALFYHMNNKTPSAKVVQAIPSVAPAIGSRYIKKLECFCFQHQEFSPNQAQAMPLRIVIDPDLPRYINTLTLSYTLFDVSPA